MVTTSSARLFSLSGSRVGFVQVFWARKAATAITNYKREFDQTGPEAQKAAAETERGEETELQNGKLGKEDSRRGQRLTACLCWPRGIAAVQLFRPPVLPVVPPAG